MSRAPLADAAARERIRFDLDATLVVEAAAGTGKTTELVARIVSVVKAGRATLGRLVAVTFTEKAAGEMKLRLRAEVERARSAAETTPEERARLDGALAELEAARMGTIHSLCADLLHERPVEARVDPVFEVAAEDEARRLYQQAFESWFQRALADPPEGVRRMLRRRPRRRGDPGPRQVLEEAGYKLVGHRDFGVAWERRPIERAARLDAIVARLAALRAISAQAADPQDWLVQSLAAIGRFVSELEHREAVRARDHDGLEAELHEQRKQSHWRWRGRGGDFGGGNARADVLAERDGLKAELDRFLDEADADLAACLRAELTPVVADYEQLKERAGKLDFLDLLVRARDLVRDDAGVRAELQERFTHIFVDEFQDTDPLQAEILLLLAAADPAERDWTAVTPKPGKLFLVGDPKQSIYRFRRADIGLYEATKRRLEARGAAVVYLTTSFRSDPAIQSAVNAAFARAMAPGGQQARYVGLEPFREPARERPAVIALPVPRPYSHYGKVTKWSVDDSLPDAVGAFVDFLIRQSGWQLTERDRPERPVPIESRHVCLLLKRFQTSWADVTRPYVEALEARRIPHVLVGGRSFHDHEEIVALRSALAAIEWPDDELAVYAALRGPFFALGDDLLLAWRHRFRRVHPLRRLADGEVPTELAPVAVALGELAKLHYHRNRRPLADSVARLLETTRAHAGIAIWPTGEQALANLLRVLDLARRFEWGGATSFRAFVERLERDAERSDASEAPVVEEGTEGVRIMTVHRAKGLEFPVVILADPTAPPTPANPSRHMDAERGLWAEPLAWCSPWELLDNREEALARDAEEAVRLAYVAATRARDLLVVPVVGDEEVEGWVDVLHPVIYPLAATRRAARAAPGCPAFGEDSVLERPPEARRSARSSVAPGLHAPELGSHGVVWWDPHALELDKQHDVGLRQQRLLTADEKQEKSEAGIRAHEAWQARRREVNERGARPSVVVRTVTGLVHAVADAGASEAPAPPAPEAEVEKPRGRRTKKRSAAPAGGVTLERVTATDRRFERPHGKRFGTLVHAVLASVALDADAARIEAAARLEGRLMGAGPAEVDAAIETVGRALAHPLLERARASAARGGCRRECPLVERLADGSLLEGVVDLAFRETGRGGASWTVVDFKTDLGLGAAALAAYEEQVRAYARGISAATGEPARGVLLLV